MDTWCLFFPFFFFVHTHVEWKWDFTNANEQDSIIGVRYTLSFRPLPSLFFPNCRYRQLEFCSGSRSSSGSGSGTHIRGFGHTDAHFSLPPSHLFTIYQLLSSLGCICPFYYTGNIVSGGTWWGAAFALIILQKERIVLGKGVKRGDSGGVGGFCRFYFCWGGLFVYCIVCMYVLYIYQHQTWENTLLHFISDFYYTLFLFRCVVAEMCFCKPLIDG